MRTIPKWNLGQMLRNSPLSGAWISPNVLYRYALWRIWDFKKPLLLVGMLNPSTADSNENDPTIEKIIKFALAHGYGGFIVVNAYAWRSTDPRELKNVEDPIGPLNERVIREACKHTAIDVLVAYGASAGPQGRWLCEILLSENKRLMALSVTKEGYPGHPLYLRDDTVMQPYTLPVAA